MIRISFGHGETINHCTFNKIALTVMPNLSRAGYRAGVGLRERRGVRARLAATWPWLSIGVRLVVGGVWVAAGLLKLADPAESVRAVRAYQILPETFVPPVGYALPALEVAVGILLVAGLGLRVVSFVSTLLLLAFIVGIASAWARGLRIECGCFGGGGAAANATSAYPWEIARDVGLAALSAFLVVWPDSRLSLDTLLLPRLVDSES
jgi:uncharacterized membrane protein YphA (DoxX/SURF4 family)